MAKTIIAGMAILLLSAGVAVAQSSSQNSMSSGTSASTSMQSGAATDTGAATTKTKMHATAHYPKGEARLNAEEAQTTKQLNMQESQEVASNGAGAGGSTSASGNSNASGGMPQ